jgi:hypothetical protein
MAYDYKVTAMVERGWLTGGPEYQNCGIALAPLPKCWALGKGAYSGRGQSAFPRDVGHDSGLKPIGVLR